MGDELVRGSSSNMVGQSSPTIFSYTKTFDDMCGYYLSIGMTYEEYWDGDAEMVKYFRTKRQNEIEYDNFKLWLQATYIYEAILDISPVLIPFAKNPKPQPFRSEPMPITDKEQVEYEARAKKERMQNGIAAMRDMMETINKKFMEKGGTEDVG